MSSRARKTIKLVWAEDITEVSYNSRVYILPAETYSVTAQN